MVTKEQVEQQKIRLREELASIGRDITSRFSLNDYINTIKTSTGIRKLLYFHRARKLKRTYEQIKSQYGAHALSLYLKLVLCYFIGDSLEGLKHEILPDEIVHLYHEWFELVLEDFSKQSDDYYHQRSESLALDMKICSQRNIPVGGARIIEIRCVGLRPFFSGGIKQFFCYLYFVLFKAHGFSPYFSEHIAPRNLQHFNEHEMNLSYQRITELMKLNPRVKGFYCRSWFLDPKLEDISSNLGYLRKVPLQNGAKLFAAGSAQKDLRYALAMSTKRRRLYKQGKYLPTGYAYVWPRKEFLNFGTKDRKVTS